MSTLSVDSLLSQLKSGRDVSIHLQQLLDPARASRAQILKFSRALLDCLVALSSAQQNTPTSTNLHSIATSFPYAIAALRSLAPYMKSANTSLVHTMATIEKYTLKLAVNLIDQRDNVVLPSSSYAFVYEQLSEALRLVLEARVQTPKTTRRRQRTCSSKENHDPNSNLSVEDADLYTKPSDLDIVMYSNASGLGLDSVQPRQDDSHTVAIVIAGALSIRLVMHDLKLNISKRISFAKQFVMPWIHYLNEHPDRNNSMSGAVFQRLLFRFFLNVPSSITTDAAALCRARVFALTLRKASVEQYALDIHKSVLIFLRGKGENVAERDQIALSVYRDACKYVAATFDPGVHEWTSNNVSKWMDHIIELVSTSDTNNSLPPLFNMRIAALGKADDCESIKRCLQLQLDLFDSGVYSVAFSSANSEAFSVEPSTWDRAAILIDKFIRSEGNAITDGDDLSLNLMFLRVINPLEKYFVSLPEDTTAELHGIDSILTTYIDVVEQSLESSAGVRSGSGKERSELSQESVCLSMSPIASALEAARCLIRVRWRLKEYPMVGNLVLAASNIIALQEECNPQSMMQWAEWFSKFLVSFLRKKLHDILSSPDTSQEKCARELLELCQICHDGLASCTQAIPVVCVQWLEILRIIREINLIFHEWRNAAETSVVMLGIELKYKDLLAPLGEDLHGDSAQSFVQDLVRAVRGDSDLNFLTSRALKSLHVPDEELLPSVQVLFGVLNENYCYARLNRDNFQSPEGLLEHMDALQTGRAFLIKEAAPASAKKKCLLRRTHEIWLDSTDGPKTTWTSKAGKTLLKDLNGRRTQQCSGHEGSTLFGFGEEQAICNAALLPVLKITVQIWKNLEAENFTDIRNLVEELDNYVSCTPLGCPPLELIVLSSEVLHWVCSCLSLRDYSECAAHAQRLADALVELVRSRESGNVSCAETSLSTESDGNESYTIGTGQDLILWPGGNFEDSLQEQEQQDEVIAIRRAQAFEHGKGDVVTAMVCASQALKILLRKMDYSRRQRKLGGKRLTRTSSGEKFTIGGVAISLEGNLRCESGRYRTHQLYQLITILFHYAQLHFLIESFMLGKYYLERCHALALHCLPPESHTMLFISSTFHSITDKTDNDKNVLREILSDVDYRAGFELGRDARSEYRMWCTMASNALPGDEVVEAYNVCEEILDSLKGEEWAERGRRELNVLRTKANAGKVDHDVLREIINDNAARADLRVSSVYFTSKALCATPTTSRRPTRRRGKMRSHSQAEIQTLLTLAHEEINKGFNIPWVCRRVWSLSGLKFDDASIFMSRKCGSSFDARRRVLLESAKLIDGNERWCMGVEEALDKNNCVLVGIDVDDEREHLLFWRISGDGRFCIRKKLPTSGSATFNNVMERLEEITKGLRDGRGSSTSRSGCTPVKARMTSKEKEEWWETRFQLDRELEDIVGDIGEHWLGDLDLAMVPGLSGTRRTSEDYSAIGAITLDEAVKLGQEAIEEGKDEMDLTGTRMGQLVLLVGTGVESIPWEALPWLRSEEVSVTRSPSLAFLMEHLCRPMGELGRRDMFYVINPSGEFKKTEERFREVVGSQRGWRGIQGQTSREAVMKLYKQERVYLYCGHGSGDAYFSLGRFDRTVDAPVALLMGCSSLRPERLGDAEAESNGAGVDFLIRGAPAVVGNLWDVSDGDIDRLTLSLLQRWVGGTMLGEGAEDGCNLGQALAQARRSCRLPYLVGAACVVIGAPNLRVSASL